MIKSDGGEHEGDLDPTALELGLDCYILDLGITREINSRPMYKKQVSVSTSK